MEFITLAEERGLIDELGNWVISRACQQLMEWDQQGAGFSGKLSINISSKQLDDPKFFDKILKLIGDIHPSRLVLELTVSVIRTIIAMSNAMHMQLIAEGIETESQFAYLVSAGCIHGQGFHFGKPVNSVEFAAQWLQSDP